MVVEPTHETALRKMSKPTINPGPGNTALYAVVHLISRRLSNSWKIDDLSHSAQNLDGWWIISINTNHWPFIQLKNATPIVYVLPSEKIRQGLQISILLNFSVKKHHL